MGHDQLHHLIEHLRLLPQETEWLEFKHNHAAPQSIGEYISALSNGAALSRQPQAYLMWGIEDGTHEFVGTTFRPREQKIGNEELENWLLRLVSPRIDFKIHESEFDGKRVVLFEIQPASHQPVSFSGTEYIRVGSYRKKLKDYPEKERMLWSIFSERPFEDGIAKAGVTSDDVLDLIDYPSALRRLGIPLPDNRKGLLSRLISEEIIVAKPADRYDITNVGAILFASDLRRFDRLSRKSPRVVIYRGDNKVDAIKEHPEPSSHASRPGYGLIFESLVDWVNDQLPQNEEIGQAFRKKVRLYPEVAVREVLANALIHQDFNVRGTGPMIELYDGRIEVTSPGLPLVDTLRFIDEPPRSRNEKLASVMRRMNICEERGSGIKKVVAAVEEYQLPAPEFRTTPQHTVVTLFAPRSFSQMDRQERIRACYQHACLWYVSGRQMTNSTLRRRLKLDRQNYQLASRILRDTVDAGLIRMVGSSRKDTSYVPFWS